MSDLVRLDVIDGRIRELMSELKALQQERRDELHRLAKAGRVAFVAGRIVRLADDDDVEAGRVAELAAVGEAVNGA